MTIFDEVAKEKASAELKFPPYRSPAEGITFVREEFEELWDEVKADKKPGALLRMRSEALQLATTAVRFIEMLDATKTVAAVPSMCTEDFCGDL